MMLITFSLFALYILPLVVIVVSFVFSGGFSSPSPFLEFSISLSGIYLGSTRDSLGTFVVPFVTAYAITDVQKGKGIEKDTKHIFFFLVGIFLLSILVYVAIHSRMDKFLSNLYTTNQNELNEATDNLLEMSKSYVKEVLAYISILLGISHSMKAKNND